MALIKCSECGKEMSDKAVACPHCGCPISAMKPNNESEDIRKKVEKIYFKRKNISFVAGAIVLLLLLVLILFWGKQNDVKKNQSQTSGETINSQILVEETKTVLKPYIEVLGKVSSAAGVIELDLEDIENSNSVCIMGMTGWISHSYTDEKRLTPTVMDWCSNDTVSEAVFDEYIEKLNLLFGNMATMKSYDGISDESYVWIDDDNSCMVVSWYENEKISIRWYLEEVLLTEPHGKITGGTETELTLTTNSVEELIASFQAILISVDYDGIFNSFSDVSASDSGSVIIDGCFCEIDGKYEIFFWENSAYQINFVWDDTNDVDMDNIVYAVNAVMGKYVRNYEYWGIYEWEKENVKVSVDPEDGVIVEKVYDNGESDLVIDTATVDREQYMALTEAEVDYDIGVVKTLMSYREKPKYLIYEKYPDAVDDDWNQLLFSGTMFGIEGRYCVMYDRETGLVTGLGFDWIPDDRETHDNHFLYCLELYFGECQEIDKFYYGDTTYYQYDWDGSTTENWSIHLSTTKESGWLQFSQLANYVPDDDDLPEERPEADDYDEFIDVITECFRYIPNCDLYFGSEDTGSPNSYTIKVDGDIIGIFGIELDSYDMISLIDPDKDGAELHHEQMAIAMIMSLDADKAYEDAREIFEAAEGDSASFSSGIYCFEGMDSGMKAFGIDITWLS